MDRTEIESLQAENAALRADAERLMEALAVAEAYLAKRLTHTGGEGETRVLPLVRSALNGGKHE